MAHPRTAVKPLSAPVDELEVAASQGAEMPQQIDGPIVTVLSAVTEPLSAREISHELLFLGHRVDRREVNRWLYDSTQVQRVDDGPPPLWQLIDSGQGTTAAVRPSQGNGSTPEATRQISLAATPHAWQSEAVRKWREHGRRGIVEAVTGAGKTMVGLTATAEAVNAGAPVVILVPTLALVDQWLRDIGRWLPGVSARRLHAGHDATFTDTDVVVSTVQTASRRSLAPESGESLLLADECHRYGSDGFAAALGLPPACRTPAYAATVDGSRGG